MPLKILAISHLFPHQKETRYGIFVARQMQALIEEGAEVSLLVPRAYSPFWVQGLRSGRTHDHQAPLCPVPGLQTTAVPFVVLPGAWYKRWIGRSAYVALRSVAHRWHQAQPFDVIYGTDLFIGGDAAWRLGRDLQRPSACLAIGADVNVVPDTSPAMHRHFVRILNALDATPACGDALARKMDAITGRTSPSIYGVVDLDTFRPSSDQVALRASLSLPKAATIVVYAGYLSVEKGLRELLEAFTALAPQHRGAHLVLCGHGPDEALLREQATNSPAAAAITFAGSVPPEDIHRFMQAADLFVLPSYHEGMPNVVMEAMACGLPVITTRVGGLPDALADCGGARLIPPREVAPLTEAMSELLASTELRHRMSDLARSKAEQAFGARPNAKRLLSLLADLTTRQPT